MDKVIRVLRSEGEIRERVQTLASEVCEAVTGQDLTVVGMLDDTFVFLADLLRAFTVPVNCCFMKVKMQRYGGQTEIMFTSDFDPRSRNILLVASVVSTGVTLDYVTKHLAERGVKTLRTCALIEKPGERRVDIKPEFAAFEEDGEYIFGYGLGLGNQYRQLPYLGVFGEQ